MAKLSAPTQRKIDALLRDSLQRHGNVCKACGTKALGPSKAQGWSFFMEGPKGKMFPLCPNCKSQVLFDGRYFTLPKGT